MSNNIKTRAREIIDTAVNAVFMTLDNDGFPHPRTMWTAGIDDDFTVHFVTGRGLLKIKQIEANPKAGLFWTKTNGNTIGWDYVLIKGYATISDNQSLRDRFWNDSLKEYFPEGKEDPNYLIITVKPREMMVMDSHKYPLDRIVF